jgi:hypothetical protein
LILDPYAFMVRPCSTISLNRVSLSGVVFKMGLYCSMECLSDRGMRGLHWVSGRGSIVRSMWGGTCCKGLKSGCLTFLDIICSPFLTNNGSTGAACNFNPATLLRSFSLDPFPVAFHFYSNSRWSLPISLLCESFSWFLKSVLIWSPLYISTSSSLITSSASSLILSGDR